jgi:cytochrome c oxidase subunit 1
LRRKFLFSTDHRAIALQYAFTSLAFLHIGFALVVIILWQLAYPGTSIPLAGVIAPEVYSQLGAMHGTIMIVAEIIAINTRKPLGG